MVRRAPDAALHLPELRVLPGLAGLSGLLLALQAPPLLTLVGLGVMATGLVLFVLRRGVWRTASEVETALQLEEDHFGQVIQSRAGSRPCDIADRDAGDQQRVHKDCSGLRQCGREIGQVNS